eukprot:Pgem_evm1s12225
MRYTFLGVLKLCGGANLSIYEIWSHILKNKIGFLQSRVFMSTLENLSLILTTK